MVESAGIAMLGFVAHLLKKMVEAHATNNKVDIWQWFIGHWAQTMLSAVLIAAGLFMLYELGDVNFASAFLMGYTGGSGADALGARTNAIRAR